MQYWFAVAKGKWCIPLALLQTFGMKVVFSHLFYRQIDKNMLNVSTLESISPKAPRWFLKCLISGKNYGKISRKNPPFGTPPETCSVSPGLTYNYMVQADSSERGDHFERYTGARDRDGWMIEKKHVFRFGKSPCFKNSKKTTCYGSIL